MRARDESEDAIGEPAGMRAHVEAGGVLLLWTTIDDAEPTDAFLLTDADRTAAGRLHYERDRRALAWSRALTRRGFALLGVPADAEPIRSSLGRPSLEGDPFHFSPSRTSIVAACAYKRADPVGLDVETRCRLGAVDDLVGDMMCAAERVAIREIAGERRVDAVLRTWTRKEAVLKAIGCGLSISPDGFAVDLATARVSGLRHASCRPDADWRFEERWLTKDVHCSVAFEGDAPTGMLARHVRADGLHSKNPRIEA